MEKKPDKRKYIIILLSILLFCSIVYIISSQTDMVKSITLDDAAVSFDGYKRTYSRDIEQRGIAIPGLKYLTFQANQTRQAVNFFNPDVNEGILINLSLAIDGQVYWSSGMIEAGKGYYEIDLSEPIKPGTYQAYLLYDCFTADGGTLNSAKMEFTLFVE